MFCGLLYFYTETNERHAPHPGNRWKRLGNYIYLKNVHMYALTLYCDRVPRDASIGTMLLLDTLHY